MNTTFGIGNVLATGFRTWFKNFLPFVLLTALVHAPLVLWGASITHGETAHEQMRRFTTFLGLSIYTVLPLNILVSGLLSYGVIMELQGQRASFGTCITRGLARFFPSLTTTISTSLAIGGAMICAAIPFAFVNKVLAVISAGVTMLYIFSMLSVSTPAAALERSEMAAALARSRTLTRGHKVAIASLIILLALLHFTAQIVLTTVMVMNRSPDQGLFTFCVYASLGIGTIVGSIGAVMATVAYYLLRTEKEGASADELAAVFG